MKSKNMLRVLLSATVLLGTVSLLSGCRTPRQIAGDETVKVSVEQMMSTIDRQAQADALGAGVSVEGLTAAAAVLGYAVVSEGSTVTVSLRVKMTTCKGVITVDSSGATSLSPVTCE